MKKLELIGKSLVLGAFLSAAAVGVGAVSTGPALDERCLCPSIYAPVICDRDRVYPNQCVADCHRAKGCVPYGDI